ncbi:MAG TPA: hypothetical protein VK894_08145 [Jiangellales bacterium]|nr:hypothetical protein [Jiangellales bacterium]
MSRKRERDERIDLSRRLGLTPAEPADQGAGTGGDDQPLAGESGSEAVRETVSLRRAQRAYRRRRRLFALLVVVLVVLSLVALGVVLWSSGVVGGS